MLFYHANKITNSRNGSMLEFLSCFIQIVSFINILWRLLKVTNCHKFPSQNSKYVKKIENTSECWRFIEDIPIKQVRAIKRC